MIKEENKDLQDLNTFGIAASAKLFFQIDSFEEAQTFIRSNNNQSPLLILGGGSNILLTKDFEGTVLCNNIQGIQKISEDEKSVLLKVGAGDVWHQFVLYCIKHNYAGIENLSLIPGKVGASPMQNIGAYGVEVKEVITEVECLSLKNGDLTIFSNAECQFDYRSSIFKTSHKGEYLITAVTFELQKEASFNTSYGAITAQLAADNIGENQLNIKAISDAVIKIRQSKLPDPNEIGNSGSFFKNPLVNKTKYRNLKKEYKQMAAYLLPTGEYKLAAGWLIEKAGWKGYKEDNYGVHPKQALVLVNYGGATGQQILDLSDKIIHSIKTQFGITLEREVNII